MQKVSEIHKPIGKCFQVQEDILKMMTLNPERCVPGKTNPLAEMFLLGISSVVEDKDAFASP